MIVCTDIANTRITAAVAGAVPAGLHGQVFEAGSGVTHQVEVVRHVQRKRYNAMQRVHKFQGYTAIVVA